LRAKGRLQTVGEGEVRGTDDAIVGLEERVLEDAGELAHIAGPGVLEEAGKRAGSEDDRALLVAGAEAIEEKLREWGNVFTALAQRRDGEANGGETKSEVGEKESLAGHLPERSLRRGEHDGTAGRAVLKILQDAEEKALTGRGKKVDAIEIGEAREGGGIGVGGQPLAGVAALKGAGGEGRAAEEITGERVFAGAMLALNGGNLQVGRGHFGLHKKLAPGGADADDLNGGAGVQLYEGKAGGGGLRVEWS